MAEMANAPKCTIRFQTLASPTKEREGTYISDIRENFLALLQAFLQDFQLIAAKLLVKLRVFCQSKSMEFLASLFIGQPLTIAVIGLLFLVAYGVISRLPPVFGGLAEGQKNSYVLLHDVGER